MTDEERLIALCRQVADGLHHLEKVGGPVDGMDLHLPPAMVALRMSRLTTLMGMRVVEDATLPPGEFRLVPPR